MEFQVSKKVGCVLISLATISFLVRFCRIRNSVVCAVTELPTGSTSGRTRDLVTASKQALKTSNYPIYCVGQTEPDCSTILVPRLRINRPIGRFSIVVTLGFQNRGVAPKIKIKLSQTFCVYGSVHRRSILIIVRDATQSNLFIVLKVHSTCFGCQTHPSSGIHKTVTTASGTGHIFCAATSLQRGQTRTPIPSLATLEGGSCTAQHNQYRRL